MTADGTAQLGAVLGEYARQAGVPNWQKLADEGRDVARAAREAAEGGWCDPGAELARETVEDIADRNRRQQEGRAAEWQRCLPEKFAGSTFAMLHPQQDPDGRVSMFLDSDHRALLLMGPSHHGKSTAAYALGNEARARGMFVVAWRVTDLVKELRPAPEHERSDENAMRRRATRQRYLYDADVLILDDLGREKFTEFWGERLYDLVEHRTDNPKLRTVFTANGEGRPPTAEKPEEAATRKLGAIENLRSAYGDPVVNRLTNSTVGAWIEGEPLARLATWTPF